MKTILKTYYYNPEKDTVERLHYFSRVETVGGIPTITVFVMSRLKGRRLDNGGQLKEEKIQHWQGDSNDNHFKQVMKSKENGWIIITEAQFCKRTEYRTAEQFQATLR